MVWNGGVNLNCTPQVGVKSGQKGGSRLEKSEGKAGGGKGKAENEKRKRRNERREKGWSYLTNSERFKASYPVLCKLD